MQVLGVPVAANRLLAAIAATGAERVWATHGYTAVLARWLTEQGLDAFAVPTRYEGEAPAQPEETELTDEQ